MNEIETVYKLKLKNVIRMKSGKMKIFQQISICKQNQKCFIRLKSQDQKYLSQLYKN